MWGTFGSVPTIFGILPNVAGGQGASSRKVSQHWHVAIMAGKVPNVGKKVGGQEASSRKVSQYWQVAIMAGKVPNLEKVPDRSIAQ